MKKQKTTFESSIEFETLRKNRDKYKGYIVMVINDKIFATKRASSVPRMIEEIEKKYHRRPMITNIPMGDILILSVN